MRIVVVEDEAMIRNGLGKMLGKINPSYELVGKAADGKEGLAVIRREQPDLVITDIQMPDMDGLSMLAMLRQDGVACKAVVLTAYSDFEYAKMAIELGIENYLLKPIKLPELKKTLEDVEKSLKLEKSQGSLATLEHILRDSILGGQDFDEELNRLTVERYGMDIQEPLAMLSVSFGSAYPDLSDHASRLLKEMMGRMGHVRSCMVPSERYGLLLLVLYQIEDYGKLLQTFETCVAPTLCRDLQPCPVCTWNLCQGLGGLAQAFDQLLKNRGWNLCCEAGTLISPEWIGQVQAVPVKYPPDLDKQAYQALAGQDREGFGRCFRMLRSVCQDAPHDPQEIREAFVRYCMSVVGQAKQMGRLGQDKPTQPVLQKIMDAVYWRDLEGVMEEIYGWVEFKPEESEISLLVKRAVQLVEEYYNQGITLEEIAQKLRVSEEYLSTQFKKETGASFSETIRRYRINKVKELLVHSNLKLWQIADMVGYSDPKYMSKVFREEVGMLPAEYRKSQG